MDANPEAHSRLLVFIRGHTSFEQPLGLGGLAVLDQKLGEQLDVPGLRGNRHRPAAEFDGLFEIPGRNQDRQIISGRGLSPPCMRTPLVTMSYHFLLWTSKASGSTWRRPRS